MEQERDVRGPLHLPARGAAQEESTQEGFTGEGGSLATMETLLDRMREGGITFSLHRHAPMFTVAQSQDLRGTLPGFHTKNLFLRDRKRQFYLLTVEETAEVDLNGLAKDLSAKRFSFGSSEDLGRLLGVTPGAVSPLGLIYDRDRQVHSYVDRRLATHDRVNVHPLRNDHTVSLAGAELLRFLAMHGHTPGSINLEP